MPLNEYGVSISVLRIKFESCDQSSEWLAPATRLATPRATSIRQNNSDIITYRKLASAVSAPRNKYH